MTMKTEGEKKQRKNNNNNDNSVESNYGTILVTKVCELNF